MVANFGPSSFHNAFVKRSTLTRAITVCKVLKEKHMGQDFTIDITLPLLMCRVILHF